jgi:hypothetical protein
MDTTDPEYWQPWIQSAFNGNPRASYFEFMDAFASNAWMLWIYIQSTIVSHISHVDHTVSSSSPLLPLQLSIQLSDTNNHSIIMMLMMTMNILLSPFLLETTTIT